MANDEQFISEDSFDDVSEEDKEFNPYFQEGAHLEGDKIVVNVPSDYHNEGSEFLLEEDPRLIPIIETDESDVHKDITMFTKVSLSERLQKARAYLLVMLVLIIVIVLAVIFIHKVNSGNSKLHSTVTIGQQVVQKGM